MCVCVYVSVGLIGCNPWKKVSGKCLSVVLLRLIELIFHSKNSRSAKQIKKKSKISCRFAMHRALNLSLKASLNEAKESEGHTWKTSFQSGNFVNES